MTEAEIMKALECCSKVIEEGCAECPMYEKDCNEVSLEKSALDLINRKNAEIEILKREIPDREYAVCFKVRNGLVYTKSLDDWDWLIGDISAEAIKEFAERVKEAGAKSVEVAFYGNGTETIEFITLRANLVDQIAKEMGCGE